jgi:hypothetical protein
MRISALILTLLITGACYPQAPVKPLSPTLSPLRERELAFTMATHGMTTDTSWQNWKILSVQKLKVSFRFSATAIKMTLPLRTETIPILQTFRRKNGALVYLVKDSPKARAIVVMDGKDLRYIVKTNRNRFFQTCYSNTL